MTTKEINDRAEELADTVIDLMKIMAEAHVTNGEEVDTLALLLGLHLHKAQEQCGADAIPKVLERFARRLTMMHPNLKAFVIERDTKDDNDA